MDIYDSLYQKTNYAIAKQVGAIPYPEEDYITLNMTSTEQQRGGSDC